MRRRCLCQCHGSEAVSGSVSALAVSWQQAGRSGPGKLILGRGVQIQGCVWIHAIRAVARDSMQPVRVMSRFRVYTLLPYRAPEAYHKHLDTADLWESTCNMRTPQIDAVCPWSNRHVPPAHAGHSAHVLIAELTPPGSSHRSGVCKACRLVVNLGLHHTCRRGLCMRTCACVCERDTDCGMRGAVCTSVSAPQRPERRAGQEAGQL